MTLSEVRAVVTGGVSGLGFAVARHIVQHGGKAVLFGPVRAAAAQAHADHISTGAGAAVGSIDQG